MCIARAGECAQCLRFGAGEQLRRRRPAVYRIELSVRVGAGAGRRAEARAANLGTRGEELVATLRASELVVNNALDALVAAGLASIEGEGAVYLPVSSEVAHCVERAEQLYRTRPNEVRRTIVSAGKSSAVAFANAFKLRRERDD